MSTPTDPILPTHVPIRPPNTHPNDVADPYPSGIKTLIELVDAYKEDPTSERTKTSMKLVGLIVQTFTMEETQIDMVPGINFEELLRVDDFRKKMDALQEQLQWLRQFILHHVWIK